MNFEHHIKVLVGKFKNYSEPTVLNSEVLLRRKLYSAEFGDGLGLLAVVNVPVQR